MGTPRHKRPLTPRQQHVLLVLSTRGPSARNDHGAWYPLHTSQVYGIMDGLSRRGLVDVAGFDGNVRTFALTDKGHAAVAVLCDEDPLEEEAS